MIHRPAKVALVERCSVTNSSHKQFGRETMKPVITSLIAALSLAAMAAPAVAQNIDTRAAANITFVGLGHAPETPTIGQTFVVPVGQTAISSFSIRMAAVPATVVFRGELMAWDTVNDRATGAVLYQSADVSTSGATVQDINFTIPGGATVVPGQTYVIIATTVNSVGPPSDHGDVSYSTGDPLPGVSAVYLNAPNVQANFTTATWDTTLSPKDLGVTVNFVPAAPTAVPTLTEWAMIGLTLTLAGAGVVLLVRRRRMLQA